MRVAAFTTLVALAARAIAEPPDLPGDDCWDMPPDLQQLSGSFLQFESGVESVAGGRFGWGVQVSPLRRPSASMSSVFLFLAPGGRPLLRFTGAASPGAGPRCAGRRLDAPCGCAGASFPSGCCSIPIWRRGGKATEG